MTDEPDKVELATPDIAAENRAALTQLFPGLLDDGVLDAAKLGELLDVPVAQVPEGRERYGLQWAGKAEAVRSLLTPSRGTLIPDVAKSIDFDTAQNVFIEGDNLEVLKLLQKAYNDKVKLIYIDPPYNTGNDFVYPDNFSEGLRGYLEYTGQIDADGNRTSASVERTGRLHSRWLNMMHPRLVLARNLLKQDGAICVSIDAHEDFSLRLLLDEVFGAENFVGQLVVVRAEGGGMADQVVQGHDSLLIYARDRGSFVPLRRPKDFRGELVVVDGVEYWIEEDWLRKEFGKYGTCHYEEILEWRGQDYLDEVNQKIESGEYRLLPKRNGLNVVGRLRPTATDGSKFYSVVKHLSREGKERLRELGLESSFDFPKPVSLIQSLVLGITFNDRSEEAVVLDFFAGSGATGDAVALQNAADGGSRRYVLVNLPEPTDEKSEARKAGFETVSEITLARLRKVAETVPGAKELGLRTLQLSTSNFESSYVEEGQLSLGPTTLRTGKPDRDAITAEVLLKEGVTLDQAWERKSVGGAEVVVSGGVAVVLSTAITDDVTSGALALKPRVLVFLEDGFAAADAVKANAYYRAKQLGITMKTV